MKKMFAVLLTAIILFSVLFSVETKVFSDESPPAADIKDDWLERIFYSDVLSEVSTFAGAGERGFLDGAAKQSRFALPYGITGGPNGGLLILDTYNNLIRLTNSGKTTTIAGNISDLDRFGFPMGGYADDTLYKAMFNRPASAAVDKSGDIYIADCANHVIRLLRNGKAYTFSGTTLGFADGSADSARFAGPSAIVVDANGNLIVADTLNNCVRMVDPNGTVTTIAGVPGKQGHADGAANRALFNAPSGIAVSANGVLYISDTGNHLIRKLENGRVTTIAGSTSETDDDGDPIGGFADGAGTDAMFNLPMGLCLSRRFLIVADSANNMIRAISLTSNAVFTVSGGPEPGDKNGGSANAMFKQPMSVYYNNKTLYIADTGNNKIKSMPFND